LLLDFIFKIQRDLEVDPKIKKIPFKIICHHAKFENFWTYVLYLQSWSI
jgi:hypothetical protein